MKERGGFQPRGQNFRGNPGFGRSDDNEDGYNQRNNYNEGRNNNNYGNRGRNQYYRYQNSYRSFPHDRGYDRPYNQNYNQNYNPNYPYYPNNPNSQNYPEDESINKEKEKIDDEKKLKTKYESFIDKIENAFYDQITREDIFSIIKSLIKIPNLTIFEAINFICREIKIYQALEYYKTKKDQKESLDWDIYENKYPEEYPSKISNEVMDSYKIKKNDENNDNIENSYYLYEDEVKDKRRKIIKNKDGIYNYLPVMIFENIGEEEKKIMKN